MHDVDKSMSDEVTAGGRPKGGAAADDISFGDERTTGGGLSGQDTLIDGIEIVDLEARYRIEGELGQGGMGAVLLATDTRLDRKVAIKRILGEAAGNRMAVQRFLIEAKAIAALNHPNIVQIYDSGRDAAGPFLIMEYVDGGNLLDRCRQGPMPVAEAIAIACLICDGLAKAHDAKIIHRDIKPANILLTKDGIPKLTDFGLAKAQAGNHGHTVTGTGAVMGTPDFMPPEQRQDAALVDHRSDLWSLAATFYQMVTGKSPKVIQLRGLPEAVQDVLGRALEDSKDARHQTARELRAAFESARDGGGPSRAMPTPGEMQEGLCTACGTLNADLSRKFCRNPQCGAPLRAPCLKCGTPIPVWDAVCGECGGNQAQLLGAMRSALEAKQSAARARLAVLAFDEAIDLGREIAAVSHPQLSGLADWGRSFAATTTEERDRQRSLAESHVREARAHFEACDYAEAIRTLESIPEVMRREDAAALLAECRARREKSDALIVIIQRRLQSKEVDGLKRIVAQALALRPDRKDLARLREQLVANVAARCSKAREAFESGNVGLAAEILGRIHEEDLENDQRALLEQAKQVIECEKELAAAVKAAKAGGPLSAEEATRILGIVERRLELHPHNEKVVALGVQCHDVIARRKARQLGEEHPETAWALNSQAVFCVNHGRVADGEPLLKRAMAIADAREEMGADKGTILDNLATCLSMQDKHDEAESLWRRLLTHRATFSGLEAEETGRCLHAFADCLYYQGRYGEAEPLYQEALAITAKASGPETARAGRLLHDLALCHHFQKKCSAALQPYRRALAIFEKVSGPEHPETAFILHDLGNCLSELDRPDEAEPLYRRALAIKEQAFGPDHQGTLGTAHALASLIIGRDPGELTPADAAVVQRHRGDLHLDSLTTITPEVAAVIANHTGGLLFLNGLESLTPEVARALAKHPEGLSLDGLVDLAPDVAEALATIDGGLSLAGVTTLHPKAAAALAKHCRVLFLDGLTDLAFEAATVLSERRGGCLVLNGLPHLAPDIAEALAASGGSLDLQRLRELSPEAAAALAKHRGGALRLEGLHGLSEEAAASLRSHPYLELPPCLAPVGAASAVVNSVGMVLRLIPAGTFIMGDADGEDDEAPYRATLTEPLYLGAHEVTNAQWRQVMGETPSQWKEDDRPVESITWDEAVEFCRRLSTLPDERAAGRLYRLPTEAEWERACRAGGTARFDFGDDESRIDAHGWCGDESGETHPVGQKLPNAWGLHDMHGNVSEWCSDWHGMYPAAVMTDPRGPDTGTHRVSRGGCWRSDPGRCRSASRQRNDASSRLPLLGMRVAFTAPAADLGPWVWEEEDDGLLHGDHEDGQVVDDGFYDFVDEEGTNA